MSLVDTLFVDNISWNLAYPDLIDGAIVLQSSTDEERKGSVRMAGGKFAATVDNKKRADGFGSDVGALGVAAFYTDVKDVNVNPKSSLVAAPLSEAQSNWAGPGDREFKALQQARTHLWHALVRACACAYPEDLSLSFFVTPRCARVESGRARCRAPAWCLKRPRRRGSARRHLRCVLLWAPCSWLCRHVEPRRGDAVLACFGRPLRCAVVRCAALARCWR